MRGELMFGHFYGFNPYTPGMLNVYLDSDNLGKIAELLQNNVSPNYLGDDQTTHSLNLARSKEAIDLLLKFGADPDIRSPFTCKDGDKFKDLLEGESYWNHKSKAYMLAPIECACLRGRYDLVLAFAEHTPCNMNYDVIRNTINLIQMKNPQHELVPKILQNLTSKLPLFILPRYNLSVFNVIFVNLAVLMQGREQPGNIFGVIPSDVLRTMMSFSLRIHLKNSKVNEQIMNEHDSEISKINPFKIIYTIIGEIDFRPHKFLDSLVNLTPTETIHAIKKEMCINKKGFVHGAWDLACTNSIVSSTNTKLIDDLIKWCLQNTKGQHSLSFYEENRINILKDKIVMRIDELTWPAEKIDDFVIINPPGKGRTEFLIFKNKAP